MELPPAIIVHDVRAAVAALRPGGAVTLLSAPGAGLYGGCMWWRDLVATARAVHPATLCVDVLDCADGTTQALAALRIGVCRLVLWPSAPGREAAVAIAAGQGGFVLAGPPPALTGQCR